ncbi:TATA element modulatory factor [Malaya genurostris]|uniref:TATA element modulatory factor n=1 Tax=Malaya genurostris TaxID=325434 RepID=UPI0026F3885A|nr:TATA element modulatory factor [Malaya genurostris]
MSWFDTTGIANLAKTALKEAQKQIDKALDIKEEEECDGAAKGGGGTEKLVRSVSGGSKTEPCSPVGAAEAKGAGNVGKGQVDSIWGSFTGSFFEQPVTAANVTVTKPPSSLKRKSFEDSGIAEVPKCSFKEDPEKGAGSGSPENSSESIELLSPVTTPGSALTSPSSGPTLQESESVEVIKVLGTASSVSSPDSITSSDRSPEIEGEEIRFTSVELGDDDISVEEDSVSYTLSEQPITVMETSEGSGPITVAPSRSSLHLSLDKSRQLTFSEVSVCETEDSNDSETTVTSVEKAKLSEEQLEKSYENIEIQTQISDSTHSFEEIQTSQIPALLLAEQKQHLQEAGSSQNSGDEIETATSSDIEIISSPNGDSSSTNSGAYRTSPLKIPDGKGNIDIMMIKKRGHNRELSEVSVQSVSSDDLGETEKLMRRITEISEILEQREFRLLEMGRQNAELHEQNCQLSAQLESKQRRAESTESEEYTQRLSALEKKFQQSIREREAYKRQLDAARLEAQSKMNRSDVDKVLEEKDTMIEELKKEGETLSKQVLNHSNIIKKIRSKERENDALIKKLKEDNGTLAEESERLKRSLSAKEEVERSQIEAVHKLSSEKRKLERDNSSLKSQLDDQIQKLETLKKSFEFAKKELTEKTESNHDLARKSALLATMETEHGNMQKLNDQISTELEDLREKLRRTEAEHAQRIQRLKNENAELLLRVEETETRSEEEKNATAMVTIPLMKQIESLQNALRNKERLWEQREADVSRKLDESLAKSKTFVDNECTLKEQIFTLNGRISNLEERLTAALFKSEDLTNCLQQKQIELELLENDHRLKMKSFEDERCSLKAKLSELESILAEQERTLATQKEQLETLGKQQNQSVTHSKHHESTASGGGSVTRHSPPSPTAQGALGESRASSPTHSMGNLSLPESIGSIPWNATDDDGMGSNNGRATIGGAPLFHTTSLLENLQATLKQRDGEVYQLQWELSRFQQERNVLHVEISSLTAELESIKEKSERTAKLEEEFTQLQERYDALLQLYGEAVEKTEELQLDLVDVKEMYKVQIDDLLQQVATGKQL